MLAGVADPVTIAPWAAWPSALLVTAALLLAAAGKRAAAGLLVVPLGFILIIPPLHAGVHRYLVTREKLTVVFSDVGQGDSILVRTPEGRHLLVDAGPGPGDRLAHWLGTWTRRIDLLVITHGHGDHYGGAAALLREGVDVASLWVNPQGLEERDDPGYVALIESFEKRGAKLTVGPPCGHSSLGSLHIRVLAPCNPEGYDYLLDWNNNSIVLHLAYGKAGFLLTGDIEEEGESRLAHLAGLEAEVIKVPHHGSPGSSSGIITSWPGAKIAVVTAGLGNPFGFPHPRVLSDFEKAGARVLRVDRDGAAVMITDGSFLSVMDYRWKEKMRLKLP
jgi:competence protein ComEC